MKPNSYQSGTPAPRPKRERPTLTLIKGEGRGRRRFGPWLIALTVGAAIWLTLSLQRPHRRNTAAAEALQKRFSDLSEIYRREGMLTFQEAKARLKLQIAESLREADSPVGEVAENLAVYLFPDLLPDDDFEKPVASEEWARAEAAIEGAPHSAASRASYQELQAEIWQYESPDAANPALSPVASEVLKLYQALSSR